VTYIISGGTLHAVFIVENNNAGAEKKGIFLLLSFPGDGNGPVKIIAIVAWDAFPMVSASVPSD